MLTILERYITKTILYSTTMVSLVVTSVLFLMKLLGEFKNIGDGDYGITQAIYYVFLRLPGSIYEFSPILILLGSIVGLSLLSATQELATMRASGYSIKRIIVSSLMGAILIVLLISSFGEGFAPHLSYKAEINKEYARDEGQAVITSTGTWLHINNNFIHIETVVGRQLLKGVTRYQFDDKHHLQASFYAKSLSLQNNQWMMHDVLKTSFYDNRTLSQTYSQLPWNLKFNTNLFNMGWVDPDEMSLSKLLTFSRYLEGNKLQSNEYRYEFWQRLFQPFASLMMIFLGIPFVLGAFRSASFGLRIVAGVMTGVIFFIMKSFLGQICLVYQFPALMAALLPIILLSLICLYVSHRFLKL